MNYPKCIFTFLSVNCSVQTIAAAIVIGIILHAGDHLACDFPRLVRLSEEKYETIFSDRDFGEHKPSYMDLVNGKGKEGVTGILMVILMAVAFILATRWFRRSLIKLPKPFDRLTGFNAFWYSHHLFVVVYVLLIIHGTFLYLVHEWYEKTVYILYLFQVIFISSTTIMLLILRRVSWHIEFMHACMQTWMYVAVPVLLYAGERTLRFFRSGSHAVRLLKVRINFTNHICHLFYCTPKLLICLIEA